MKINEDTLMKSLHLTKGLYVAPFYLYPIKQITLPEQYLLELPCNYYTFCYAPKILRKNKDGIHLI